MATEDFLALLAASDYMLPLEEFDRKYLVEYLSTYTVKTRVSFRYLKTDTFEC
jgi:hypothetical protein